MDLAAPRLIANRKFQESDFVSRQLIVRFALLVSFLVAFVVPTFGQNDSLVQRLPADTWLYVHWHGTSSLAGVRDTNSVLRLLRDPSITALRQHLLEEMKSKSNQKPPSHPLTEEDADNILSMLDNPLIFGFLDNLGTAAGATSSSASSFLILDTTGKQDVFAKIHDRIASTDTVQPERIPLSISRIPVTKLVTGTQTSYEAETASYFVRTDSLPAMAELLRRLTAASQPTNQIEAVPEIPTACRDIPRNSLLDYLVLPSRLTVSQFTPDPNFNLSAFLKALHVDQIHAICGNLKFESAATRMQGAIIGDTSAGSVLNLFGDSRSGFATMALAPSGAAYQCTIVDLAALYSTLKTGLAAGMPPERAGLVAGFDSLLATSWGTAPADALQLFTGEFAVIRPHPAADPSQMAYALSIHQPDKVLGLLRKILTRSNPEEKQEGDTTYLTLALPSSLIPAAQASLAAPSVFTLAVAPNLLIVAQGQNLAREAVARAHRSTVLSSSDTLFADAAFQKMRASMPAKLSSLSYTDLAHFNWEKIASDYQDKLNAQLQAEARASGKPAPPRFDFFTQFDWQIIPRYLQTVFSGGWKDSSGIYFDSFIQ